MMLAKWTKVLPFFCIVWLSKRYCERVQLNSGLISARPYGDVVIAWRAAPATPAETQADEVGL